MGPDACTEVPANAVGWAGCAPDKGPQAWNEKFPVSSGATGWRRAAGSFYYMAQRHEGSGGQDDYVLQLSTSDQVAGGPCVSTWPPHPWPNSCARFLQLRPASKLAPMKAKSSSDVLRFGHGDTTSLVRNIRPSDLVQKGWERQERGNLKARAVDSLSLTEN